MKSGLDGRNNLHHSEKARPRDRGLNEVRPRWPEQSVGVVHVGECCTCGLNEVRPRWPEQLPNHILTAEEAAVSMKSGLDGRNNNPVQNEPPHIGHLSQ